ncbi:sensor histidine kinase [Streptomyces tauricus]|uniref:sensor histidine kinase n=1 Tax=Streptomyces tauricus TaxID=68274 RepID=UPI0022449B0D|nr:ATP-binding protein [Streptomyces tauricus]MCW8099025.1 ATP-binding protein [Streptomyces tauricus]
MNSPEFGFTVDTHLFRELGELLVGRDSTALVELVKNSYDADATQVILRGEGLIRGKGQITVADDGVGMTPDIFQSAFLRIAGRYKEGGARRSPLHNRQYTGAKGVGRLSAHKLAEELHVLSYPNSLLSPSSIDREGVSASIDWKALEENSATLDQVGGALRVKSVPLDPGQAPGTTMCLKKVRGKWSPKKLVDFVQEVSSCLPPAELLDAPSLNIDNPRWVLGEIKPWSQTSEDPGFKIKLEGELNTGEPLWMQLIDRSNWLLEVDAQADGVRFAIHPTRQELKRNPRAQSYYLRREHPDPQNGPFFVARIYSREGPVVGGGSLADFADRHSGIRMYMEGFRVVPYGDPHDDWLGLNRDYVRRVRGFTQIPLDDWSTDVLPEVQQESFKIRGNRQYIGGVFLTAVGGAALRPVVNREGFLQDEVFETLRLLVRNGVDLLIRAQAAATEESRGVSTNEAESEDHSGTLPNPNTPLTTTPVEDSAAVSDKDEDADDAPSVVSRRNLKYSLTKASLELTQVRGSLDGVDNSIAETVARQVEEAVAAVDAAKESAEKEESDYAMLQVLAGVGLQFAAFVHEVNGLLSQAQQVRKLAEALPVAASDLVKPLRLSSDALCQSLARQASYLTEVVGPDARRRRKRIPLHDTTRTSLQLLDSAVRQRGIEVVEDFEPTVKTPPIFPAELTIIFTNLLTNAVKAAGEGGKILISGGPSGDGGIEFRVENSGLAVNLTESERWFRPFESTTTEVDVLLGQGMGLGLPITRRIVSEYSGRVRFVRPSSGYATAVQINLPPRKGSR